MTAARTVLIAAGGTGGHLFPAAAFAEEMRARGWRTALMTDSRGRTYAANFPADSIEDVPAATFSGANPLKAIGAATKIARGVTAASARLKVLKPAIVAGFGGYPSLPALWAARGLGVPILIHEQKFPDIAPGSTLRILVIGGSQGARILGDVVPAAIGLLPDEVRARVAVEQQVREEQVDAVRRVYAGLGIAADIAPFFTDMADRYARAHLVIARAGASSATEIAVVGRPAIFVPLAIAADDHQTANAEALTAVSAADAIPEAAFTPDALAGLLALRLSDPHDLAVRGAAARAAGKPDAAKRLADIAEQAAWPAH
ncbi:MAG: UDP-N-acetylglucosamine--N-acetylmuramyl-(pentapeptide) pyrophosphoryl-undecaprenol N-acetylglucosamine transferase [Alphaproteobacteria bacterium]|nr:UDP-N-acetylglucosamine--N-acetylmuramyl-(pentapeptide) pyrophosphoryl-undecaprenol N-acetylglucosamine transferase [Alphaproteobacteria bacterium]